MNELLNNKLNNLLKIWLVDNTVTVENTTNRHSLFTSVRNPKQEAAPTLVVVKAEEEKCPTLRHK